MGKRTARVVYNTKATPCGNGFYYKDLVSFKPEFDNKFNVNENQLVVLSSGEDENSKYVQGYIKVGLTPTGRKSKAIIPCIIRVPIDMVVI